MRVLLLMGLLSGCANWDGLSELYKGDGGQAIEDWTDGGKADDIKAKTDGGDEADGAIVADDGAIAMDMHPPAPDLSCLLATSYTPSEPCTPGAAPIYTNDPNVGCEFRQCACAHTDCTFCTWQAWKSCP